jgi:hypothetical protein
MAKVLFGLFVGVLGVLVLAVLALLFLPAIGGVSAKALNYSVAREADGSVTPGFESCRRHKKEGPWTCAVLDRQGSDTVAYRVRMTGSRCWRGRKISRFTEDGPPLEHRPTGCVKFRDQLRLVARATSSLD